MQKVHGKICNYVTACVLRLLIVFTGQTLYSTPGSCGMILTVLHLITLFMMPLPFSVLLSWYLPKVGLPKVHSSALFFLDLNWIWQSCLHCHRFAYKQVAPKWNLNLALSPQLQTYSDHLSMVPPRQPMNISNFSRTKLITKPVPSFCK